MMKICLFLSTLILCAPGAAIAAPGGFVVSIERIVDSNTPLPETPEMNFSGSVVNFWSILLLR